MRVLIAGCGDLGARVAALHVARGDAVWGLRRGALTLPGVTALRAPLATLDAGSVPAALDRVYMVAAPGTDPAGYAAVYESGLAGLLRALAGQPAARVILTTSTRPYAQRDGTWVDETSPVSAHDPRAGALLAAEQRLQHTRPGSVCVRLSGLYGADAGRYAAALRAGRARAGTHWTNRIHRQDAARALVHLADLPDPAPCYLGTDPAPAREHDVLDWLATRLKLPAPPRAAPDGDQANRRCSSARLVASGFAFAYPDFRAGYAATLDAETSAPSAGA